MDITVVLFTIYTIPILLLLILGRIIHIDRQFDKAVELINADDQWYRLSRTYLYDERRTYFTQLIQLHRWTFEQLWPGLEGELGKVGSYLEDEEVW